MYSRACCFCYSDFPPFSGLVIFYKAAIYPTVTVISGLTGIHREYFPKIEYVLFFFFVA